MENIKTIIEEIKEEYPLYKIWVQFEYQLDLNRVVLQVSQPYDNEVDSDYELELLGMIKVNEVHDKLIELKPHVDHFEIIDMTEGNFYHQETAEKTLKYFAKYLLPIGTKWMTKEQM